MDCKSGIFRQSLRRNLMLKVLLMKILLVLKEDVTQTRIPWRKLALFWNSVTGTEGENFLMFFSQNVSFVELWSRNYLTLMNNSLRP